MPKIAVLLDQETLDWLEYRFNPLADWHVPNDRADSGLHYRHAAPSPRPSRPNIVRENISTSLGSTMEPLFYNPKSNKKRVKSSRTKAIRSARLARFKESQR